MKLANVFLTAAVFLVVLIETMVPAELYIIFFLLLDHLCTFYRILHGAS
jgi:hypothetical protein